MTDLYVEDPVVRSFCMGLWYLLLLALANESWWFTDKIAGDISALLHDLAGISALEEEGVLTIKMKAFHELTKIGKGVRPFTDSFMDLVKDLTILQCGLPESYIR